MDTAELSCKELVELVTEYFEDTLPPAERARFEEHLAGCCYCRLYLEQMRQTIHMAGGLTEESAPVAAKEGLLQAFRDWKGAR
jgi:anti-sigma factor RsiW